MLPLQSNDDNHEQIHMYINTYDIQTKSSIFDNQLSLIIINTPINKCIHQYINKCIHKYINTHTHTCVNACVHVCLPLSMCKTYFPHTSYVHKIDSTATTTWRQDA